MYIIDVNRLTRPFLCKIGPWRQSQLLLAGLGFVGIKIACRKSIEISRVSDFLPVCRLGSAQKSVVTLQLEQGNRAPLKQQDSRAVFSTTLSSGLHRLQLLFPEAPDER